VTRAAAHSDFVRADGGAALLNWEAIARAHTHPLRLRILEQTLAAPPEGDKGWSPKTLTPLLGASLGDVSYHVRTLRDAGLLVEVDKRQVRGAMQTFYRLNNDAVRGSHSSGAIAND
jgi:DNA-binding transcriptional ArsR family regulator